MWPAWLNSLLPSQTPSKLLQRLLFCMGTDWHGGNSPARVYSGSTQPLYPPNYMWHCVSTAVHLKNVNACVCRVVTWVCIYTSSCCRVTLVARLRVFRVALVEPKFLLAPKVNNTMKSCVSEDLLAQHRAASVNFLCSLCFGSYKKCFCTRRRHQNFRVGIFTPKKADT